MVLPVQLVFISSTNIAWTNYSLFNNILVNNLKKNFTNTMQLDGKKQELSSIIKDKDLSVSGGGELTLKQDTDLGRLSFFQLLIDSLVEKMTGTGDADHFIFCP